MTTSAVSRDIVTARFLFNAIKGNRYQDTLKDTVVGDYKWSARNADFSGWVICDGRSLNRNVYSQLYAIIGTTFGSASGTTFNLPDCRGKVAGAAGQGAGLTNRSIGDTAGTETHALTVPELPGHTHTYQDAYFAETNGYKPNGGVFGLSAGSDTDNGFLYRTANGSYSSTPQNLSSGSTGGNSAFSVMQPTIFLGNVFIYSGILEPLEPTVYTHDKDDDEYGN